MYAEGDYVGIDEDARAYDAPHHDHGGVENSEQLPWLDGIHKRWLSYSIVKPAERRWAGLTAITLTQCSGLEGLNQLAKCGRCDKHQWSVFSCQFPVSSF